MSIASTAAKNRWNKANYAEVKASLSKDLVEQFKSKCKENGVSIASTLAMLMSEYCSRTLIPKKIKKSIPYDTRLKRRKSVTIIADQLENILQCESTYRENMPENLGNSSRAEASDTSIDKLQEALDVLREAY